MNSIENIMKLLEDVKINNIDFDMNFIFDFIFDYILFYFNKDKD